MSKFKIEVEPIGYVAAGDIAKLRQGFSYVELFPNVVPKGIEMVPLYKAENAHMAAAIDAYERGARWRDENGSLDGVSKAAYDYADKNTSVSISWPRMMPGKIGPEELLTTIKEFAQWHHLNEMTIAKGGTPSDSEIDFEVLLWNEIKRAIGAP